MRDDISVSVWDKFWAGKELDSIYPPVTDIVDELTHVTTLSGKKVLEVGAGTGRDSFRMSEHNAQSFLLDYSRESLRLAASYPGTGDVTFVLADARRCPFKDTTFDIVFHQGLLEHFISPFSILEENRRILKKGGLLVVDVPQTLHVYTLFKHALIPLGLWFGGWERQFTQQSLARLLKEHGFEPLHYYGDWSRPGILYKLVRMVLLKVGVKLPMFPLYAGALTRRFYRMQHRLRKKKLFLYTVLSIGIIARKMV